jgi:hypothetical protein
MRFRLSMIVAGISCVGAVFAAGAASAGQSVDPSTLTPEPPPGATCQATGKGVTCKTVFDASFQNEPAFTLSCGQIYESASDVRRGTRWYVDGLLVRRLVFQNADGRWSLSPTGEGPTVRWTAQTSWENSNFDATQPEDTWPTTQHGMTFKVVGDHGRPIFQYTGLDRTDGSHSGHGDWAQFETPETDAAICAVLTS